jgi:hypothetical protein
MIIQEATQNFVVDMDEATRNDLEKKMYIQDATVRNYATAIADNNNRYSDDAMASAWEDLLAAVEAFSRAKNEVTNKIVDPFLKKEGVLTELSIANYNWNADFSNSKIAVTVHDVREADAVPELDKITCPDSYVEEVSMSDYAAAARFLVSDYLRRNRDISITQDAYDAVVAAQADAEREFDQNRDLITREVVGPYIEEKGIDPNTSSWTLNYDTKEIVITH